MYAFSLVGALIIGLVYIKSSYAAEDVPYFPVIGSVRFSNDFYAGRSNGLHHATDIIAAKHSPIIAPVAGTVIYVNSPEASWGYSVGIRDAGGTKYNFIHMNNDTPGSDDGRGGEMNAYAPDMKVGNEVVKGQLLGYVGDSGNAETTVSHLHFEIVDPSGNPINPYDHLLRWTTVPSPSLYPPLSGETLPYWVQYNGGVNVATGDFNRDSTSEIVTSTTYGYAPRVNIYKASDKSLLSSFDAFDPSTRSGADVAAGDMEGDGIDEVVVVPGPSEGPLVRIFNAQAQLLGQFYAYDSGFKGGVRVAVGDVNGDSKDEIVTVPESSGGPWVRVYNVFGQKLNEFPAFDPEFRGGADVGVADTVDDSAKEIIAGPGNGGGPWLRIFKREGTLVKEFPVYDLGYTGGIRVSGGNVRTNSAKDELMTIPANYGESRVRLMKNTGENITDYAYLEKWWKGYYDVAAGESASWLTAGGNRRGTLQAGPR